jgi:hypothetical protein
MRPILVRNSVGLVESYSTENQMSSTKGEQRSTADVDTASHL